MSRGKNQKFKLYTLAKIMLEKTDQTHAISAKQILSELEEYEVACERKSIYNDLKDLDKLGIHIERMQVGRDCLYYAQKKPFELAELKLLVDSIQCSKFITEKKSKELIKKLEKYASENDRKYLKRQVYVQDRVKAMNESIYQVVDAVHEAINMNRKIRCKYSQWNIEGKLEYRRGGEDYTISPWAFEWDAENYYLIGYDDEKKEIRHYRVDKISQVSITNLERSGREVFRDFNPATYAKKNFSMFGGRDEYVSMRITNNLVGVFIDRFGSDIPIQKDDEEHVIVKAQISVSKQFYGWIFGLEDEVEILSPENVVEGMREMCEKIRRKYFKEETRDI